MLNNSIEYEINRKEHSDALLVGGILSYPDSKEFYYVADGAHDAHILSNNLTNNGIDTVTLFEKDGVMPSPLECTYPLNYENFHRELNKNYDFIYSFVMVVILWCYGLKILIIMDFVMNH